MFKNYIKIAWRNLLKNSTYSLINIIGLTIGLAACLAVTTVVIDESSYDRFWTKKDQIFRVNTINTRDGELLEKGEITRLAVFMPPRHGKSMLCSEFFPAWYLGNNPNEFVIQSTYAQELADDFGRKVRNQLASPDFNSVFPQVGLRADSSSAKRFHTCSAISFQIQTVLKIIKHIFLVRRYLKKSRI